MTKLVYNNNAFTVISIVTMTMLSFALCVTIGNMVRHTYANYTNIRKRSIVALFAFEIACIFLLVASLWLYANWEPILIYIVVINNLIFFFVFNLIKLENNL